MSAYPLTERERQALAQADRLNAILSQSSIKEGSEAAQIRAREQAAARLQAQRNAADQAQLDATLAVRQGEGRLKREADAALISGLAGLTAPEQRDVRGQEQTHAQLGEAIDQGENVLDTGGNFAGAPHVVISALRDWEFTGMADLIAQFAYSPQERSARGAFSNAIANWRKNLSGAQVTGIERVLGADWDPTATADPREAIARAARLQDFIQRNRQTLGLPPVGIGKPPPEPKGGFSDSTMKYYNGGQ